MKCSKLSDAVRRRLRVLCRADADGREALVAIAQATCGPVAGSGFDSALMERCGEGFRLIGDSPVAAVHSCYGGLTRN